MERFARVFVRNVRRRKGSTMLGDRKRPLLRDNLFIKGWRTVECSRKKIWNEAADIWKTGNKVSSPCFPVFVKILLLLLEKKTRWIYFMVRDNFSSRFNTHYMRRKWRFNNLSDPLEVLKKGKYSTVENIKSTDIRWRWVWCRTVLQ